MIQPLSMHSGILQANQLSSLGGGEKPGEMEHDGDGDGGAGGAIANPAATNNLPSFLGTKVNTLA